MANAKSGGRKPARKRAARSVSRRKAARPAKRTVKKAAKKTAATKTVAKKRRSASGTTSTQGARKARGARVSRRPLGRTPTGRTTRSKVARLDRERRQLEETVQTPPSSLDLDRRGTSARTGRRGMADTLEEHAGMTGLTGGDIDADFENAYFSGDEAPGGDNPTPDQDIVDDIGKSLGVEYQDNEELKAAEKVTERDKHRWELDPASSEDYKERE